MSLQRRTFRHRDTRTGRRPRDNTADGRERLLQAKNPKDLGETTRSWESRAWKRRSRPRWEPRADLHPGLTPPGQRDNRFLQFLVPTDARTEPVGNASGARLPRSTARSPRPPASGLRGLQSLAAQPRQRELCHDLGLPVSGNASIISTRALLSLSSCVLNVGANAGADLTAQAWQQFENPRLEGTVQPQLPRRRWLLSTRSHFLSPVSPAGFLGDHTHPLARRLPGLFPRRARELLGARSSPVRLWSQSPAPRAARSDSIELPFSCS